MCNYANRIVKDRGSASDIVQDVFVYVWEKRDQLDLDQNIKSYLFQTTYHRCINHLKQSKVVPLSDDQFKLSNTASDAAEFQREADIYAKKE